MTTWNEMTEVQKMAHSLRHGNQYHLNPERAGMLTQAAAYNSNRENDGLTFGANTGPAGPAYAPSSGINPERDNPYGVTGVDVTDNGGRTLGFSGNPEHFVTGQAARDLLANAQGNPMQGGGVRGDVGLTPAEPTGTQLGQRQSTPFLDSYMRARESAQATGPVSQTMKKYMEE